MKIRIAFLVLAALATGVHAADVLRIKATKQLDSRKNTGNQSVGAASTSLTQKDYLYRFDVQAVSPQVANPLTFEWVIMAENWEGRSRVGTHGTCQTNVQMTRAVSIETEAVRLDQRNWRGPAGGAGKIEDKIAGYGLRVTDKNGNLIAEDYEPSSLKKEVDWKKLDEQPANEDALRAIKGLLEAGGGGGGPRGGGDRLPPPRRRP